MREGYSFSCVPSLLLCGRSCGSGPCMAHPCQHLFQLCCAAMHRQAGEIVQLHHNRPRLRAVLRCAAQAGDIFQLVLSQRFERRTFADPFEIYRCALGCQLSLLAAVDGACVGSRGWVAGSGLRISVVPCLGWRPGWGGGLWHEEVHVVCWLAAPAHA